MKKADKDDQLYNEHWRVFDFQ
ncbi:hypothetical protein PPL_03381 [Heterostelium album PN500]|uniref:Uncharacterized protein n=1 Tax=Heterostelium pallidum (strain ATCC 26659 / Pp 5 / PN500) TaxID=670386 RepID=D3B4Q6_HETP5|nr:hypothetical protein PPL_03381 [Heterostelium album PN500]